MKDIKQLYIQHCIENNIIFKEVTGIVPDDGTTLFITAGMQNLKPLFLNQDYKDTFANIQPCIRINDLDEISDGNHLLHFNMIGYFSFRDKTVKETFDFFMSFLNSKLNINFNDLVVTVHPDKIEEWGIIYEQYYPLGLIVNYDEECIWSDGNVGGYCTEFYIKGIEIGNIVNPLGDCIDVGFGLERLDLIVNGTVHTEETTLLNTINKILEFKILPSAKKQGYILRKLISLYLKKYFTSYDDLSDVFKKEYDRIDKTKANYLKNKQKHKDKSAEWWLDTFGIDISEFE